MQMSCHEMYIYAYNIMKQSASMGSDKQCCVFYSNLLELGVWYGIIIFFMVVLLLQDNTKLDIFVYYGLMYHS